MNVGSASARCLNNSVRLRARFVGMENPAVGMGKEYSRESCLRGVLSLITSVVFWLC